MPRAKRTPWDLSLSPDKKTELGQWLTRELDNALMVRTATDQEVSYWHTLYEQGRTRSAKNSPWPDAADLTSAIGTEKVSALRDRIIESIFADEPVFTVEGWGDAGPKAPFVEEFHQWQLDASDFQATFYRAVHLSLIEPRGVLEVYEETGRRPVRRQIKAALQLAPDGSALIGEDLQPVLQQGPDGKHVEVTDEPQQQDPMLPPMPPQPSADVVIDDYEPIAVGPCQRVIAYRDFLQLPAHAKEQSEVWGYAKRFWRKVSDLKERAKEGVYDTAAVEELGTADERQGHEDAATTLAGDAKEIPSQEGDLAEKELYEVTFLKQLDKTGIRWFVATVHRPTSTVLRCQFHDIGKPTYFSLVPFPRPDSMEGFSFIGHILITTIEENTAWRNMLADRASLQLQAPLKRQQNALWDPEDEPLGPKAVITVRDMNEVMALELPDYTAPARERIIDTERMAEKLGGLTDIAAGSKPQENRTLGETRLVTAFSEVRVKAAIRCILDTLEEIQEVRHLMWKRALAEMPDGMEMPTNVLQGLERRGVNVAQFIPDKKMAASLMEGAFRFKPRGSVEAADKHQQRADFAESLKALGVIMGFNPMVGAILQQPQAAKALLEKWVHLYGVADKQAFLSPQTLQLAMNQVSMMGMGAIGPGGPGSPGQGPTPPFGLQPPGNKPNAAGGAPNPGRQLPQEKSGVAA